MRPNTAPNRPAEEAVFGGNQPFSPPGAKAGVRECCFTASPFAFDAPDAGKSPKPLGSPCEMRKFAARKAANAMQSLFILAKAL